MCWGKDWRETKLDLSLQCWMGGAIVSELLIEVCLKCACYSL